MAKCVKCGRCVEACQEVQTTRAINTCHRGVHYEVGAPYDQSLANGPCVFCGQCAKVCPVGAIYEHDQSAEAWAAINDKERPTAVQFPSPLSEVVNDALGLPTGTITPGKMVTALKRLGFDQVFDTQYFANAAETAEHDELLNRITNNDGSAKLPMITGCSAGCIKFIEDSYPDLTSHLSSCKNTSQTFYALITAANPRISAVSIFGCLAQKYKHRSAPDTGLVLTVNELARMFTLAGANFVDLPETPFGEFEGTLPQTTADPVEYRDIQPGIKEAEIAIKGKRVKALTVHGFAKARVVMDSIRRGECDADIVKIKSCPFSIDTNNKEYIIASVTSSLSFQ